MWKCECDCGKYVYIRTTDLTKEKPIQSCVKCGYKRMGKTNTLKNHLSLRRRVYRRYEQGAKDRNYSFELMFEEVDSLIKQSCQYCGESPTVADEIDNRTGVPFKRNGIDRKNNNLGYSKENTVACCKTCNLAKLTMGYKEFIAWINKCYKHLNK